MSIRVAENVLAGALPPGLRRPLVCRWPEARPVKGAVVFCHGLGASGRQYATLSESWAEAGFLVVHPTFDDAIALVAARTPGLGLDPAADLRGWASDPAVLKYMHGVLLSPISWLGRIALAKSTLDALPRVLAETCGTLAGPLPTAIAGHSFGAYVAQLLAGAVIDLPGEPGRSFRDRRLSAAILLSAQGRGQQGLRDGSWDGLDLPAMTVTGTRDRGASGLGVDWKSEPFALASAPRQHLVVLEDGDHHLGGFDDDDPRHAVPAQAEAVRRLTALFLDATLGDDARAAAELRAVGGRVGDCALTHRFR